MLGANCPGRSSDRAVPSRALLITGISSVTVPFSHRVLQNLVESGLSVDSVAARGILASEQSVPAPQIFERLVRTKRS